MKHPDILPPKYSSQFLNWALPAELRDPIMGDLDEEYIQQLLNNPANADSWYRNQAMRSALQFIWKTKRGLFMLLISLLVFIGFTFMGMWFSGGVDMFIDVPSFLIVIPAAVAFTIAATSWQRCKQAITHFVSQETHFSQQDLVISKQVYSIFGNVSLWLGSAMTVVGWIAIGSNLDDPSSFGPAFAVSILTLLYAMLIKIVCYVAEQKIQYKINLQQD